MKYLFTILFLLSGFWNDLFLLSNQRKSLDSIYSNWNVANYEKVIDEIDFISDSLLFEHDGLKLIRANAFYKMGGFGSMENMMRRNSEDSTYISMAGNVNSLYTELWLSENLIASNAFNQTGVLAFNSGVINGQKAKLEDVLKTSVDYFKNAMLKNPDNEEARYNYELLLRYKDFPNTIMKQAEELIQLHEYEQAFNLIAPWVQQDQRFKEYKEYTQRLGEIVRIEKMIQDKTTGA